MLPIGRTISVGGVLLAMTLVALALSPPGGARAYLAPLAAPARGPLIDRRAHPEWRQLRMRAAFRRAAELKALRAQPDSPVPAKKLAALPDNNAGAPAVTGSAATIPIGIGEASSTELPVVPHEERPPVITTPQLQPSDSSVPKPAAEKPLHKAMQPANPDKPSVSARQPHARRVKAHARRPHRVARSHHGRLARRTKRSTQAAPAQFDLLQALFAPPPHSGRRAPRSRASAARY